MKKIVILSCFIAFAFVVLFPRSFIFAAEETEHVETVALLSKLDVDKHISVEAVLLQLQAID